MSFSFTTNGSSSNNFNSSSWKYLTCKKCKISFLHRENIPDSEFCFECSNNPTISKEQEETKFIKCPGCGRECCYYLGVTPISVKCANADCRWYQAIK